MKDNIIGFLLTLIILIILGAIGIFGYIIYNEMMETGNVQINFEEETGFPTIQYTPSNSSSIKWDSSMFEGVEGSAIGTSTTTIVESKQSRHLYEQLENIGKVIYNKIYENKEKLKTGTYRLDFGNEFQILLTETNGDVKLKKQYQSAIEALIYENPDVFYLDVTKMYINIEKITKITGTTYNVFIDNGNDVSYLTDGFYSKEDIEKYEVQIEQAKQQIVSTLEGKNDYQKIKAVHNYLIDTIQYEEDLTQSTIYDIYGALVVKRCVCEGYAKAFQYIMNEIGIENTIVIGEATNSKGETENHAWNYVKLNGQWFAVDVTWDDPIIIGNGKLSDEARYEYFLKGSNTMNQNHVPSGKFTKGGQLFSYPQLSIEDYE